MLLCYWKVNIGEPALSVPLRCGLGVNAKKPRTPEGRVIDRWGDHIRSLRTRGCCILHLSDPYHTLHLYVYL